MWTRWQQAAARDWADATAAKLAFELMATEQWRQATADTPLIQFAGAAPLSDGRLRPGVTAQHLAIREPRPAALA